MTYRKFYALNYNINDRVVMIGQSGPFQPLLDLPTAIREVNRRKRGKKIGLSTKAFLKSVSGGKFRCRIDGDVTTRLGSLRAINSQKCGRLATV